MCQYSAEDGAANAWQLTGQGVAQVVGLTGGLLPGCGRRGMPIVAGLYA
jgi:hypothetical protein